MPSLPELFLLLALGAPAIGFSSPAPCWSFSLGKVFKLKAELVYFVAIGYITILEASSLDSTQYTYLP